MGYDLTDVRQYVIIQGIMSHRVRLIFNTDIKLFGHFISRVLIGENQIFNVY